MAVEESSRPCAALQGASGGQQPGEGAHPGVPQMSEETPTTAGSDSSSSGTKGPAPQKVTAPLSAAPAPAPGLPTAQQQKQAVVAGEEAVQPCDWGTILLVMLAWRACGDGGAQLAPNLVSALYLATDGGLSVEVLDPLSQLLTTSFDSASAAFVIWLGLGRFRPVDGFFPLAWQPNWKWVAAVVLGNACFALLNPDAAEALRFAWQQEGLLSSLDPAVLPMLFAAVVGLGPVVEEAMFRGFLLQSLVPYLGRPGALLLSTLVFRLEHPLDWYYDAPFWGDGAFWQDLASDFPLGLAFLFTGSLWPSIFLHASWNAVSLFGLLADAASGWGASAFGDEEYLWEMLASHADSYR